MNKTSHKLHDRPDIKANITNLIKQGDLNDRQIAERINELHGIATTRENIKYYRSNVKATYDKGNTIAHHCTNCGHVDYVGMPVNRL